MYISISFTEFMTVEFIYPDYNNKVHRFLSMKLKQYLKNFHNFLINQGPAVSKLSVLTTLIIGLWFNYHRVREDSIIILPTLNGEWITIRLPSLEKIAYVPAPADADHGTAKHLNRIKQIYKNDEIQISEDDIVFDIGAYVGTFTIFAAETARTVFAIDPSASRNDCLKKIPTRMIILKSYLSRYGLDKRK